MDAVLLIDKPAGMSSHDVVASVRRAFGGKRAAPRVGHAGTLDPFATGLLLVLLGRATKSQQVFMRLPKRYGTIARLGATSSTGDPEGEITVTGRIPPEGQELPTGEVLQRPPMHSAIKVGGERAYKRARRGESFEMPERIVTVSAFRELWRREGKDGPEAAYEIECGSGTYVRSLIADLHDAYCLTLRRTGIGSFDAAHAIAPPSREESWIEQPPSAPALLSLETALTLARQ